MDRAVNNVAYLLDEFGFGRLGREGAEFVIDTWRQLEMHSSLALQKAGLHAKEIVVRRFLIFGIEAFEQELCGLEIVVGIVFIAD